MSTFWTEVLKNNVGKEGGGGGVINKLLAFSLQYLDIWKLLSTDLLFSIFALLHVINLVINTDKEKRED